MKAAGQEKHLVDRQKAQSLYMIVDATRKEIPKRKVEIQLRWTKSVLIVCGSKKKGQNEKLNRGK